MYNPLPFFFMLCIFAVIFSINILLGKAGIDVDSTPQVSVISVKKIWDVREHSAFTDLIFFKGKWFVTFRESDDHVGGEAGVIRLIASDDGEKWESAALFSEEGVDLRDPKLSITPDNRLMLLMGGTVYSKEGKYITSQPRVNFSLDGSIWSERAIILEPHEWLWRVTWMGNMAYGVAYRSTNLESEDADWIATLFSSDDGVHFKKITTLNVPGRPSETTIRFLDPEKMVLLIRRGGRVDPNAWIGTSNFPFTDWAWNDAGFYFGGPNFLILPDDTMLASGRILKKMPNGEREEKTIVGKMTLKRIDPLIELPSSGDTSYPGMVYQDGVLWISYYSSHEGSKTAIYLAKLQITPIHK